MSVQHTPAAGSLPATLRLGPVHLTIRDLDRSVAWYERSMGLHLHDRNDELATLGGPTSVLVVLHEDASARPVDTGVARLHHYCLLYADEKEFAQAVRRVYESKTEVKHLRDRRTHQDLYLPDADGIMVELAWDRPRDQWPVDPYGRPEIPVDPADVISVVAGEPPQQRIDDRVVIGHVNLCIGDLDDAVSFYCDAFGFELEQRHDLAAFFAVGGYHHQIATNIMAGTGLPPMPEHTVGLSHLTLEKLGATEIAAARSRLEAAGHAVEPTDDGGFVVLDPWRMPLRVIS